HVSEQRAIPRVFGDSNNLNRRSRLMPERHRKLFTNRVLTGPKPLGQLLTDDRDGRRTEPVAVVELTAFDDWNSESPKIVWSDPVRIDSQAQIVASSQDIRRRLVAWKKDVEAIAPVVGRNRLGKTRRDDSGNGFNPIDEVF